MADDDSGEVECPGTREAEGGSTSTAPREAAEGGGKVSGQASSYGRIGAGQGGQEGGCGSEEAAPF